MISSKSKIKYRKKTQKKNKKKGGTPKNPKGKTFIQGNPHVNPHPQGQNRRQGYARLPSKSTPSPRNLTSPPPVHSNLSVEPSPNYSPSSPPPGSSEWSHNVLTNSNLPTTFIDIPTQKKELVKPVARRGKPPQSMPLGHVDIDRKVSKKVSKNQKRRQRRIAAYKSQNQHNIFAETSQDTNNSKANLDSVNLPPKNVSSENLSTANLSSSKISPSRKQKSTRTLAALTALGIAGGIGANHYYNNSKSSQLSPTLPNVTPTRDIPTYLNPNFYDSTQPRPAGPPSSIDMYSSPNNYGGKNKKSHRKNKIRKRKTKKVIYKKKTIRKR